MKARDIYQYVLGALIVAAFFLATYLLIYNSIPVENRDVLNMLLGALIAQFVNVVGYFYGSSRGSADKTEILAGNGKNSPPSSSIG